MAGISSKALAMGEPKNKEKTFQGQRFDDDLDLNWVQFKWRNHDPQLGRFMELDPLAEKFYYNSTYSFSENKVICHIELEGLESVSIKSMASNGARKAGLSEHKNFESAKIIGRSIGKTEPVKVQEINEFKSLKYESPLWGSTTSTTAIEHETVLYESFLGDQIISKGSSTQNFGEKGFFNINVGVTTNTEGNLSTNVTLSGGP